MRAVTMALALTLAACSPAKSPPPAPPNPEPSAAARQTFAACAWGEVKGATVSMWSYACGPEAGGIRLVADDALPGFALESAATPDSPDVVVVRLFDKPADAPIESVLEAVRALSPGLNTPTCAFEPATGVDHEGKGHFVLAPTGIVKAAYEKANSGDTMPEAPCGPLGISPVGDRYFTVVPGHADKVMYVDRGSEIQIFDETTLRITAP